MNMDHSGHKYVGFWWVLKILLWTWQQLYWFFLTAIGLTPGGSNTVHIYTQTPGGSSTVHIYTLTIHRTTQLTTLVGRLSGIRTQSGQTNWEECGPFPVCVSYTLEFALQLRKMHGKTSVSVAEECQLARRKQNMQNRTYITIRIHKYNNKNT
jgi:hypothetical protein